MPEESEKVRYDVDGYDIITESIKDLLNSYPGLLPGENITFSTLGEDSGVSFYPVSGAVIATETEDITGRVDQLCSYPFYIVYRTSAGSQNSKIEIKEFLDNIGKWLEKQPVKINDATYTLESYPEITDGRIIESVARQTPSYLDTTNENEVQDWVISMDLQYRNIFYR